MQLHSLTFKSLFIVFVGVIGIGNLGVGNEKWSFAQSPQFIPYSFADIAEKIQPAVVNVSTLQTIGLNLNQGKDFQGDEFFERFLGETPPSHRFKRQSLGSGVIIEKKGYIVTNNHVIENADEIHVRLSDNEEFEAEIIGRDVKTDIALIRILERNRDFPVAHFGNSDTLRVGEWVIAVGNPYGLSHTVTAGIISAKGRVIGGPYDDFIQTDASINPGNSGGPLININGEVIGINTAIFSNLQGNRFAQGIGFAIPINIVKDVVNDLHLYGKVRRGWVGIVIQEVTPEIAASFNLPNDNGALVTNIIPDGPADKAGVTRGDVILRFNEIEIINSIDLPRIAAEREPGTSATLLLNRDGEEISIQLILGEFPVQEGFPKSSE
jgi:serine protease Do